MAGFVGGGVLGGTGNPALAGMAGGASYGLLDGVAHTDPQGSFADNSLMVLQSTAIGGMAGGMGGLAGGGVAGALAGTSLSMTTQAFLAGSAAGIYGGSTARILSGTGITPATVTQDAFMGGANGLIFYGVASAYQQVTAPKPSTTSLQERANLAAELSEAEGCKGDFGTQTIDNKFPDDNQAGRTFNFTVEDGKINIENGIQEVDFVIDMDGNLHIGRGHSYLSGGQSVQAAGTMQVNPQGYIRNITNESGHFQPTVSETLNYPQIFRNSYLDVDNTWIKISEFNTSLSNYVIDTKIFYNGPIQYMP